MWLVRVGTIDLLGDMNGYDVFCLHVGGRPESGGGEGDGLDESTAQLAEETQRVATTTAAQTQGDLYKMYSCYNDCDSALFGVN